MSDDTRTQKPPPPQRRAAAARSCFLRFVSTILAWALLTHLGAVWQPRLLLPKSWPSVATCGNRSGRGHVLTNSNSRNLSTDEFDNAGADAHSFPPAFLPRRAYKSNGYLMVSCNGGLNQMRAAICDMVTIARYLNLTLVVPELDKTSFWADPSEFGDIFDVDHFINSLKDEVKIVKSLPEKFSSKNIFSMPPVSWSSEKYYLKQILPLIKKHKVVHFNRTDARLANNGVPFWLQKLRCRVNYAALRFTPHIEALGNKLISILRSGGLFLVLHLRYEMDMLAFSGCTHGCSEKEIDELTMMRYNYPWWKEKEIDSLKKRLEGLCPLTPEEAALVLRALGFSSDTQIYIASGEIYGGERRLAAMRASYPRIVRKEMLLSPEELKPLWNHSTQMAALDYMVSIESDVFVPSYDGNMAKVVEGHRRYNGFLKTITLDRRKLVELLDQLQDGKLSWDHFSDAVRDVHNNRTGQPALRKVIPGRPKEEDYFYSNPQECVGPHPKHHSRKDPKSADT